MDKWLIVVGCVALVLADVSCGRDKGSAAGSGATTRAYRLVYRIKAPAGQTNPRLAQRVVDALKRRVDPDGVMNLRWQAEGDRIEILAPMAGNVEEAIAAREAFIAAARKLDSFNVNLDKAKETMGSADPARRKQFIDETGFNYPPRVRILNEMAAAHDKLREAKKKQASGDVKIRTEGLREEVDVKVALRNSTTDERGRRVEKGLEPDLEGTNLSARDVQKDALDFYQFSIDRAAGKGGRVEKLLAERGGKLEAIRRQNDQFPARLAALSGFVEKYDAFAKVRHVMSDAEDLKRLLRGSGVLEFHILYTPETAVAPGDNAIAEEMIARLNKEGPSPQLGDDKLRWFEVDRPRELTHLQSYEWGGKTWALCYVSPEQSMVHKPGEQDWGLKSASRGLDANTGEPIVNFTFDARAGRLFGDLSGRNLRRNLAVVLDGKIVTAPVLQSRITEAGQISGKFTNAEIDYLVRTLNAGSLPAQLEDEPIVEEVLR